MAVCDASLKFINLVARWPGSSHDALVWNNSTLRDFFRMVIKTEVGYLETVHTL